MKFKEKHAKNTADFLFRLAGILLLLLIIEIFEDMNWKIICIGIFFYYILFCIFHVPNGYIKKGGKIVKNLNNNE